ncbi:GNAT family N-acetyltransferase [Paenibacillus lupini]|uniref:GNAT family N-acetyltransferase n=1 Tax=Paenibacillus lupini TaxID=1450204 RepID=UPI00141E3CC5|nr:GNAT family N-acetyltransferase [Paenibacillus lupini]NIK26771.1 putative acetyltransferase [Paenibacillus lupini]
MTKEIRLLTLDQYEDMMELSQFAFQYEVPPANYAEARNRFEHEEAERWGIYLEGKLAAQLGLLEFHTYIGGKRFAMSGVAGVSTWPEFRRQGLVAELLHHSLVQMKEKGQTLSFLHPFSVSFYRKFGWELYTDLKTYKIDTSLMPPRTSYNGTIKRVAIDYELLNPIYQAYAKRINGALDRSEAWWNYRIKSSKKGQTVVYFDTAGEPQGYVIYVVKNRGLLVHEFIDLTEEARLALWSFLSQHDSMIDQLEMKVAADDGQAYLLANPRIKQEIMPYFMARIVDAEAFLREYPFEASGEETSIVLDIQDEHAPWNEGIYQISIDSDGTANVQRLSGENNQETIQTGIGALAAMLTSYKRPTELLRYGQIHGDRHFVEQLERRIPVRTTFLPDFF